jgi:hypothetical protein
MGVMGVMLAATTRNFAVPAHRIIRGGLIDLEWRPGIFMRGTRSALPDAGRRLG